MEVAAGRASRSIDGAVSVSKQDLEKFMEELKQFEVGLLLQQQGCSTLITAVYVFGGMAVISCCMTLG